MNFLSIVSNTSDPNRNGLPTGRTKMTTTIDDSAETTKTKAQHVTNEEAIRFAEFVAAAHADLTKGNDRQDSDLDEYEAEQREELLKWFVEGFRGDGTEPVSMCEFIGLVWAFLYEFPHEYSESLLLAAQRLYSEFGEWDDRTPKKTKVEPTPVRISLRAASSQR
jgi:hypothetical protein